MALQNPNKEGLWEAPKGFIHTYGHFVFMKSLGILRGSMKLQYSGSLKSSYKVRLQKPLGVLYTYTCTDMRDALQNP